jgi:hypothetical protein
VFNPTIVRSFLIIVALTAMLAHTSEVDAQTPLRSWAPAGAVRFKTSVSCHTPNMDYYGVFAVFEMADGTDQLWNLVVDGLAPAMHYGELVDAFMLASAASIDHVDCDNDEYWWYVVWDRSNSTERLNARWARTSHARVIQGPYTLPDCGSDFPPFDSSPFLTAIARHDGQVAISSRATGTCGICADLYRTNGDLSQHISYQQLWGGSPTSTDIQWNGDNSFLIGVVYQADDDNDPPDVLTVLLDPDGTMHSPCGVTCTVDESPVRSIPQTLELVYSPNDYNYNDYLVIQTDQNTIWVDQSAQLVPSMYNPTYVGLWPDRFRASCEAWGEIWPDRHRIAHTYAGVGRSTRHHHWSFVPARALETYSLNRFRRPDSCASSDGYRDAEVLLVSRSVRRFRRHLVYFNLDPQD